MLRRLYNICLGLICAALLTALAAILICHAFPTPYRETVESCAEEYGVTPSLIYAVIKAESNFDPTAVSPAGAKGLAQLTDSTAQYAAEMAGLSYSDGDSFDSEVNIRLAACYLKYLLEKYGGDQSCAVAAYNAGEGNVDKWLSPEGELTVIPFGETSRYLRKVRLYRRVYGLLLSMF